MKNKDEHDEMTIAVLRLMVKVKDAVAKEQRSFPVYRTRLNYGYMSKVAVMTLAKYLKSIEAKEEVEKMEEVSDLVLNKIISTGQNLNLEMN